MSMKKHTPGLPQFQTTGTSSRSLSATKTVILVWMAVGLGPLFLQIKGFAQFVTPHKISLSLVTPVGAVKETENLHEVCPVYELYMASSYWNVNPTHYFHVEDGVLCHYVMPQYNLHGNYFLGNQTVKPYHTTPDSCAEQSYFFENYFYHGSLGYYSFYAEGEGTYCAQNNVAYDIVTGVGTLDVNGAALANDKGRTGYQRSYWYAFAGSTLVLIRCFVLRRSYVACKRFARQCDQLSEPLHFQGAFVFVQESMRLSAHGARNHHRTTILFLLLDQGLMSDLFLLITQEGFVGRIQCISLGYNLAGIMSLLFEMVETMNWMPEKIRSCVKRLLFNFETALIGELLTAVLMQYYLTVLNRSSLRDTEAEAKAVSYYVMSLVGHGVIAIGCVIVIVCTRSLGAIGFVLWKFGTLQIFTTTCSVDATLGLRNKLMLLGGYAWSNGKLYYKTSTLKAFGILRSLEEDGTEFLVYNKLRWIAIPREYLYTCGVVSDSHVTPSSERLCKGDINAVDRVLGGDFSESRSRRFSGYVTKSSVHHTHTCHVHSKVAPGEETDDIL